MNMDEYGARGYLLLRNRKDSNYVWRHVSLRMLTRKRCGHADQQLFDASLLVLLLQRPDLKIPPHYSGWLATDDWAGWSAAVHSKAWIAFNPSQNHLALLRHLLYLVGIAAMNYVTRVAKRQDGVAHPAQQFPQAGILSAANWACSSHLVPHLGLQIQISWDIKTHQIWRVVNCGTCERRKHAKRLFLNVCWENATHLVIAEAEDEDDDEEVIDIAPGADHSSDMFWHVLTYWLNPVFFVTFRFQMFSTCASCRFARDPFAEFADGTRLNGRTQQAPGALGTGCHCVQGTRLKDTNVKCEKATDALETMLPVGLEWLELA